MKKTGSGRFGAVGFIALALIIVFSVMALSACNGDEGVVAGISVKESSVKGYYVVGEFDISSILLEVTYEDSTAVNEISATKTMLTTESANSLKEPGEKNLTIAYKGKTTVLTITLVEDGAQIACVTFNGIGGQEIGKKYSLVGGSVEALTAPEVEGQRFVGWFDAQGNAVDLSNVTGSINVFAQYTVSKSSHIVRYTDYKGNELKSGTVEAGTKVTASDVPAVSLSQYPELESFGWSESFPFTVNSDVTVKMVPDYKKCGVMFAYAYESNPTAYTYVKEYATNVVYGTDVSAQAKKMENFLVGAGYEIVSRPSQGTVIKQSGMVDFIYIIKDASIQIKVYKDADKKTEVPYDSPMKIGSKLTFPSSAATVNGYVLSAWKVSGANGSREISVLDNFWTVTKELGLSVEVTPVYSPLTVQVGFVFDFKDDKFPGDDSTNYRLTLTVNDEFALGDAVTYRYIDNLLTNIADNKADYLKLLSGQSVSNPDVVRNVRDNGSRIREQALNNAHLYGITSVSYVGSSVNPGGAKIIAASGTEFVISVSAATVGIDWEEVRDGETVIGYKVIGLNAEYNGDNVFIPDNHNDLPVVGIGASALSGRNVTRLSANLVTIEGSAFEDANIYGNIVLPGLTSIGSYAFANATFSGEKIEFAALETMGEYAFNGFTATGTTVNLGVKLAAVPDYAFNGAEGINSVTMPETVTAIGEYAFADTQLSSITSLAGAETVGAYAFSGTNLAAIDLPKAKVVGEYAFNDNSALETLFVGTEATEGNAFYINAFTGCVNIKKVVFGAKVSSVEPDAAVFAAMTKLVSIEVSEGSASLYSDNDVLYAVTGENEYRVLYYPNDKTGSYSASLPEGATLIVDANAFAYASIAVLDFTGVDNIGFENSVNTVYAVAAKETATEAAATAFVGATVVTDASEAAFGYDQASGIIYKLVTSGEGENAVTEAVVVSGYRRAETITVPATLGGYKVTAVANGAFAGFENLTELTVLATLKGWDASVLAGDDELREFTVKGWDKDYEPALADFANNGWYVRHNVIRIGGALVGYNNDAIVAGKALTVVTAEEAAEYFAEGIPAGFFADSNLTQITLPASVKIIGEEAFKGSDLEKFGAAELTSVGESAFENCANLTEIALNFMGTAAVMYENVFKGCSSLTKASIFGGVNTNRIGGITYYSLPAYTFSGCGALTEVTLEKINEFGKKGGASYAFDGCSRLAEFDFTKMIGSEIPQGAFRGSGLGYAILTASTLTSVGQEAFSNCSALKYVQFGATVRSVDAYAFDGCGGVVVELSYDNGGLYDTDASVGASAFPAAATFFISQAIDPAETEFLNGRNYQSSYPIISFALTEATRDMSINFTMTDITTKVFLREQDVVAPVFSGYTFAGWFSDAAENNAVNFPVVIPASGTLYAKYYDEKQGSVSSSTDVKYVYYLGATPSVSLDSGERAEWYYSLNGGVHTRIESLPLVVEAAKGDAFRLILTVKDAHNAVVYGDEFDGIGELGYAIVGYSGSNPSRMSIPDVYDDGENGSDEIIVLYAGAFRNCIPEEFFIPAHVKAILTGNGTKNDLLTNSSFVSGTTFGNALKYVTVPAATEYIADGVFIGAEVEEIVFEDGSNLTEATEKAFFGSKWWNTQIERAGENGGFITAGRLAVKFVGTADVMLLPAEQTTVVTRRFGFAESTEELTVTVKVYKTDGSVEAETLNVTATKESGREVYIYSVEATTIGVRFDFALNTVDSGEWTYTAGKHLFILNRAPADAIAISVASSEDSEVSVPVGTVKLGDGIFKGNVTLKTLIINKELKAIGDEAFADSGLSSIRYGATNSEQYVSSVSELGKDAFRNTAWYKTEKVVLGTTFLKYNNTSGTQSLTITESITKIADEAFKGATLTSVSVSSSTLKEIGAFAFKNSSVGSIILPKSVEKLGRGVFAGCTSLVSANLSMTAIKELPSETFKGDSALGSLALPASVTALGKDALAGCRSLSSITADGIVQLEVSGDKFESGLSDTAWYNATDAGEKDEDSVLRLGNVLVKYVVGRQSRAVYEETHSLTVEIPAGITMIAYKAFSDDNSRFISEIVLPDSVAEIGDDAFTGCKALETVQFGSGLKNIGARAFKDIATLKNAVLPEGLLTIGNGAFYGTSLTSEICDDEGVRIADEGYTIPSTVTEIGSNAFYGVNTLTVINLGAAIIKIGAGAFKTAGSGTVSNLYKVNWLLDVNKPVSAESNGLSPAEDLAKYIADNGNYGGGIFVTGEDKKIRFYAAAETVLFVKDGLKFNYASTWNGYGWQFFETGSLPEVKPLSSGYTLAPFNSEYIKDGDIPVPPHSTDAGGKTYTFMYWVIVNGPVETKLTYPYVVTSDIDIDAKFYTNEVDAGTADDNGVSFSVDSGDKTASITGFTGAGEVLYVPNKIGGKTVNAISAPENDTVKTLIITNAANFNGMTKNIFSEFTALESIELRYAGYEATDYKVVPVTLTATYGNDSYSATFYAVYSNDVASGQNYGTRLIAVIGNVEAATESARLEGYTGAEPLDFVFDIPEGVTEIYDEAMVNCGFATVGLPSTLTAIGENAFGNKLSKLRVSKKISLSDVTRQAIDPAAPIMNREAGAQTATTNYIEINGLKYKYGNYGYFYAIANVLTGYESAILEYLGQEGFVMPNSVNGIDITVLASGINARGDIEASVLTLPTNLTRINSDAFAGINFKDVLNADGYARLRDIASNVFEGTDFYANNQSTSGLYVGKILVKWANATDGSTLKSDTIAIASNAFRGSKITRLVIPDSVVSIGENAFYGCVDLVEITISNSVTTIGNGAFMGCKNLQTVNIDTINSTLATLGDKAFENATSLRTLRLPYSLKSVGARAFSGCTSLVSVTFDGYDSITDAIDETKPSGLTELGESAFLGAKNLAAIKIPQGITVIKESTFENCSSLVTVEFARESRLSAIGSAAFSGCIKLGSVLDPENPDLLTVEMPDSLVSIGYGAFMNCTGMWGISFGHNLDSLGEGVFSGCVNLAKVEMRRSTAPTITSTTFGTIAENNYRLRIYVQGDEAGLIKAEYVRTWSGVWDGCGSYIYERGALPKIIFKNSAGLTVEKEADVIVNPSINFGAGEISRWEYESLKQADGTTGTRTGDISQYKNQSADYNDATYVFLIVDYDEVTVKMLTA